MSSSRWLDRLRSARAALRRPVSGPAARPRDRGVALLIVITWVALMVAVIAEFTYGTSVDAAQAANARDELRAHYLARSAVNLSRLLIKIQQRFVDPIMGQAQAMLGQLMGGGTGGATGASGGSAASAMGLGFSLRVTDYAGPLMGFFSGSKDEVQALGGLIGINTEGVKGLGLKSGRFDAEITSEDGKIDVNCGGGVASSRPQQTVVFQLLSGLFFSRRYERLFSEADRSGQLATRLDVARAIIDWADGDEQMFSPDQSGSSEDYRYDALKDRYRAHNNTFDTVEEIKLVRGVTDGFMEAFQPYLTVYPHDPQCRVNLTALSNKNGDCAPLVMGIIRAAAMLDPTKPPSDPTVLDDRVLYPIATLICDRATGAGIDSTGTVANLLQTPQAGLMPDDPRAKVISRGITINRGDLDKVAFTGSPRVYKIVATGEAGKVKKKITAIVDTKRGLENPLTMNPASEKAAGVIQYWREE